MVDVVVVDAVAVGAVVGVLQLYGERQGVKEVEDSGAKNEPDLEATDWRHEEDWLGREWIPAVHWDD